MEAPQTGESSENVAAVQMDLAVWKTLLEIHGCLYTARHCRFRRITGFQFYIKRFNRYHHRTPDRQTALHFCRNDRFFHCKYFIFTGIHLRFDIHQPESRFRDQK